MAFDSQLDIAEEMWREHKERQSDPINHPSHYTSPIPGIECIDVVEHLPYNRGCAIKYIWRAGHKDPAREVEDLRKAEWYIKREIGRIAESVERDLEEKRRQIAK